MNSPTILSAKWNRIITLDDLLKLHEVDTKLFEVLKYKANVREQAQNKKDDSTVIVQLHQVAAELKPIREVVNYRDILLEVFNEWIKAKRSKKTTDWELLWVIPHFDLHIDKYTNWTEQYLREINDKTFDIFNLMRKQWVDKVLYVNGWDYYNSDGKYKTTKWTEQFNSMTEKESFRYGLRNQIELIETLSKELPTDVMYLSWNHDDLKLQAMSDAVDIYFSKDGRVNINNDDQFRKYYDWWTTTIWAGHWDWVKDKDLLSVYAMEHWLNENNVYMKWHIHHRLTQMFWNLIVETFGTPSNPWERDKKMGYIGKWKIIGQMYDKKEWKYWEFQK